MCVLGDNCYTYTCEHFFKKNLWLVVEWVLWSSVGTRRFRLHRRRQAEEGNLDSSSWTHVHMSTHMWCILQFFSLSWDLQSCLCPALLSMRSQRAWVHSQLSGQTPCQMLVLLFTRLSVACVGCLKKEFIFLGRSNHRAICAPKVLGLSLTWY